MLKIIPGDGYIYKSIDTTPDPEDAINYPIEPQVAGQIPNTKVLARCDILGKESFLIKGQQRWVSHMDCMENTHTSKALFYGQLSSSTRHQGHSLLHYKDTLKIYLKISKINLKTWELLVLNRTQWRSYCYQDNYEFEAAIIKTQREPSIEPDPIYPLNEGDHYCNICSRI
uniref:Uncharacterized protein n=1 Tax=Octopus bimaculoides TaxID=37653 RepID=A0A0L8H4E0_OCTBM